MTVPDDSTTPTQDEVPAPVHLPTEPDDTTDADRATEAGTGREPDPVVATAPEADDDVDPDHRDEDVLPHVPPGTMASGPS